MPADSEHRENEARAREFLSRVRVLDEEIGAMLRQISGIRQSAARMGAPTDCQPTRAGYTDSYVESAAVRAADLSERVKARYCTLGHVQKECLALISRLPIQEARALLTLRYIHLYSWERVAREMHYELRSAYRLHNRGLRMAGILLWEDAEFSCDARDTVLK